MSSRPPIANDSLDIRPRSCAISGLRPALRFLLPDLLLHLALPSSSSWRKLSLSSWYQNKVCEEVNSNAAVPDVTTPDNAIPLLCRSQHHLQCGQNKSMALCTLYPSSHVEHFQPFPKTINTTAPSAADRLPPKLQKIWFETELNCLPLRSPWWPLPRGLRFPPPPPTHLTRV